MRIKKSKKEIRKQVYELTFDDISIFPIWEFALDEEGENGQDELTVRPYPLSGSLDPNKGIFIVRADFKLADDTSMSGYITLPEKSDKSLGSIQPVIITEKGQVSFWKGNKKPSRKSILESYNRLGKQKNSVFPIHFKSSLTIPAVKIEGFIRGFLFFEKSPDSTIEMM